MSTVWVLLMLSLLAILFLCYACDGVPINKGGVVELKILCKLGGKNRSAVPLPGSLNLGCYGWYQSLG